MKLKTYRAPSMGEALAEVKRDLGRDAVILHTRAYRVGAVLGVGGREVVEITASDSPDALGPRVKPAATRPTFQPSSTPATEVTVAERLRRASTQARSSPAPSAVALPAEPVGPARRALATADVLDASLLSDPVPQARPANVRAVSVAAVSSSEALPTVEPLAASAMQELAAIKKLVHQVLQTSRQAGTQTSRPAVGPGPMPDPLFEQYLRLIESDVAAELADELVGKVREELPAADLARPAAVRKAVLRKLAELIPTSSHPVDLAASDDARPLTIALVGPTGVGKTTTVAKLAANYKLRQGKRVGLITTDTYRIGAVDQLRTYAEIIGLPLKVAMTPAEMADACAALSRCDVVLIDTAGRSPRDAGRLDELRQFVAAARPHQTHLVLSGASSQAAMLEAASRFASLQPDRLILTKLDEAVNLGVIVNVARRVSLNLSYITTGQEVPDHIEVGRADRVAQLVLAGTTAEAAAS